MNDKSGNDISTKNCVNAPCTILIVEADEGLARLIEKRLGQAGIDVAVTHNGAQAIDWMLYKPARLVILDYKLPDMSAIQILESLQGRKIEIPFIIMTGHGDEKVAVEMMKAGARDYIVKQGEFLELLTSVVQRVCNEIGGERRLAQATRELEESEKKYRSIVDNALVGVYKTNIKGDIMYVNRALSHMFGCASPEEMMLGNILEIFKSRKDQDLLFDKLYESGSVDEFECECITRNGNNFYIIMSATLEGDVISGVIINITSRKKMEKLLAQSEKLRAMGVMSAGIAHDFNNVLAIINGYTQLMEITCDGNEELLNGLCAINNAVNDGAETVRRLSEFTRAEKSTSKHISVNMVNIITQSIEFSKPQWKDVANAGGVTYNMNIEGLSQGINVLGNPALLREVVINMINNAIDAMPGGGCITFRAWEKGNTAFMSIADNGCGMSQEVHDKIFDPFFSTKGVDGTGLGMSVSYGIVRKHGGKIDVSSQIGKGSVFTIELPVATEIVLPEVSSESEVNIKADNYRILVADDVKEISGILYMFLSRQGYNVDKVESGAEAIKLIKRELYDLVICDLGMPEVSGWDIIKVVESLKKKPKVGLVTGWADMLESLNKDNVSADFVIGKPIRYNELSLLVKETLLKESHDT